MKTTPETLMTRIHTQADESLTAAITEAISNFTDAITELGVDYHEVTLNISGKLVQSKNENTNTIEAVPNMPERVRVPFDAVLSRLAFELWLVGKEANRERVLDTFIAATETKLAAGDEKAGAL